MLSVTAQFKQTEPTPSCETRCQPRSGGRGEGPPRPLWVFHAAPPLTREQPGASDHTFAGISLPTRELRTCTINTEQTFSESPTSSYLILSKPCEVGIIILILHMSKRGLKSKVICSRPFDRLEGCLAGKFEGFTARPMVRPRLSPRHSHNLRLLPTALTRVSLIPDVGDTRHL